MFNNFFFSKSTVCEIMWKNIVEPERPQITKWHMRTVCWIPKSTHTHTHTHTLRICNTYRFHTAKITAPTRLNVPLYVHCLSCYNTSQYPQHQYMLRYSLNVSRSPIDKYAICQTVKIYPLWEHTYIRTYLHTYIYTYILSYIRTFIHT